MNTPSRPARGLLAAACVGTLALGLAAPAGAATEDPVAANLTAVPAVEGPVPETDDSYLWSTMERARKS